jgi:cellulose synthase/poly-beta-1,6-N-acetylglucosamine synthase-like glycosyltransferase
MNPENNGTAFGFSVIVPCLNEEKVMRGCLQSLVDQDVPRDSFEVIVVDNGSKDSTVQIAESFAEKLHLTVIKKERVHVSAARNAGAAMARGQYLAFLDADCLAPKGWIREGAALFEKNGDCVIGAPYLIPASSAWVARTWYQDRKAFQPGAVSYVPAGDLMMSRAAYARIGGFDEELETNEDCELCSRALGAGMPTLAFSSVAVEHLGTPQSLGVFFRKQRWHGKHAWKVFFRSLPALQNARPLSLAAFVLVCLLGIACGLVLGLTWGRWEMMAMASAGLILGPLALGMRTAAVARQWSSAFPLAVMFLVFGVARIFSLKDFLMQKSG